MREQSLAGLAILAGLPEEDLNDLEAKCTWRRYAGNQIILDQHATTNEVCFVVTGAVRIVSYAPSGREISFSDVPAGGYFGELAAIDGDPRSASVIALEPTNIAAMAADPFIDLLVEYPSVALAVMRDLTRIIRSSTARIMDLSVLGANNRVQAEILRLAREASKDGQTARIWPIPVHSDIAARVSTTRETVARVLSDLSRHELVAREGHVLVVRDINRLSAMVEAVHEA